MQTSTPSRNHRLLLAADVGGTKTLLQLRSIDGQGHRQVLAEQRYRSDAFDSLTEMLQRFIDESDSGVPDAACLAVAGPVHSRAEGQYATLTNLPWQLDSRQMSEALAIPRLALLNDFQAIGYSLDELAEEDIAPLHPGTAHTLAPRLVVGAGTGLGVCTLFQDNGRYISYPSEGGHLAFAPRDEEQVQLLRFLESRYGRVSYERLISGLGLENIYRFMLERESTLQDPLLEQADPAAAIGEAADSPAHPLALKAVRLFCRLYGAFAGEMALGVLPAGGVYIAGGIAPKLLSHLQEGPFMEAFLDKGRMSELMQGFPVQVITNPNCGLLGAAHYAARL